MSHQKEHVERFVNYLETYRSSDKLNSQTFQKATDSARATQTIESRRDIHGDSAHSQSAMDKKKNQ